MSTKQLYKQKRSEGFTIIEVMIVLAIAGLIMVIVFIAVPQLQRNQRDNARQNAVNRLKAELDTYASNNNGNYPFKGTGTGSNQLGDFVNRYITDKVRLENPRTGATYTLVNATGIGNNPTADQIMIYAGSQCSGENIDTAGGFQTFGTSNNQRQYALRVQLDRNQTYYCVDNGS